MSLNRAPGWTIPAGGVAFGPKVDRGAGMAKFGAAPGRGRREDIRFLTGTGGDVDDVVPKGALHCHFLRSNRAHARIGSMDLAAARRLDGVHLALAADDLPGLGVPLGMAGERVATRDGGQGAGPERPVLAPGAVRYVGEPVAQALAAPGVRRVEMPFAPQRLWHWLREAQVVAS